MALSARAKLGARAAVVSALLAACAFETVDWLAEPVDTPDAAAPEASRPVVLAEAEAPTTTSPCDKRRRIVSISIDGAPTEVEVFVECDPTPYRELGDPPPSPP